MDAHIDCYTGQCAGHFTIHFIHPDNIMWFGMENLLEANADDATMLVLNPTMRHLVSESLNMDLVRIIA